MTVSSTGVRLTSINVLLSIDFSDIGLRFFSIVSEVFFFRESYE